MFVLLMKSSVWCCQIVYPRYSLFMVGSTMSGFGSNTSDVDMCLMVRQTELDQRGEALYHLTHIMEHFISYGQ
ncbi:hypothetical protein LSTR_LSTR017221 [Laodelphax striatellus]|uniref:Poly(A) RNA polymerase mitochondrial-like central palm domain-containing protein n=1 Tax=Laodelphax striatellus TaxID=195883 RepID=A0A482XFE1_LAOST|nr:hypothetical protein LSTR_LSTR017221 [Laodelphax striatellus]